MVDILHRVGAEASSDAVFDALTRIEGLAGWWTADTSGDGDVGGVLRFRFGDKGGFDMNVVELDHGKHVHSEDVDGPEEWIGTRVDEAQLAKAAAQLESVSSAWDARLQRIKKLAEAIEKKGKDHG